MQLVWRIYAVFYLVLYATSVPTTVAKFPHLSPVELVDMAIFTPIAVIGLWSAAYRHLNLPKHGWKILLFASVFWRPIAVGNALMFNDTLPKLLAQLGAYATKTGAGSGLVLAVVALGCLGGSLYVIPPLVALYRNAYGDESLLKLMSPSRAPSQPPQQAAAFSGASGHPVAEHLQR